MEYCSTKTAHPLNCIFYKQKDGVSVVSSLGPVLANIIMTELGKKVVAALFQQNKKFYTRSLHNSLLLGKEDGTSYILEKFNAIYKNLKFTTDCFDDDKVHFLDILTDRTETDLFYKPTHAGQYSNITINVHWNYKAYP